MPTGNFAYILSSADFTQYIGLDKQNFSAYIINIFSYSSISTYVIGAQKNHLNETVLLSTHNICFG